MERRKRNKKIRRDGFDFTISVISDEITIELEISYIKSILLYADSINIISPLLSSINRIIDSRNFESIASTINFLNHMKYYIKDIDINLYNQMDKLINLYYKNKKNRDFNKLFSKTIEVFKEEIIGVALNTFREKNLNDINKLIKNNTLKILQFNSDLVKDTDRYCIEYYNKLKHYISLFYTVLDDISNELIKYMSEFGIIDLSNSDKFNIKHGGLTEDIMMKLPTFDFLDIDEILDIKKELNNSIVRFRSAMLGYTDEIKEMPWNEDFYNEAHTLYNKRIKPSLQEIDELTKENSFIKNLGLNLIDNNIINNSLQIGIGVFCFNAMNEFFNFMSTNSATISGLTALTVSKLGIALKDTIKNKQDIKKKDLYFYYKAKKLIENKTK